MESKGFIHFTIPKNGRVYSLLVEHGASYGETFDALQEISQSILNIAQENIKKKTTEQEPIAS